MTDDPRFANNLSRCAHRAELDLAIEEALAKLDPDTVAVSLKAAGIAFGFVNSVAEFSSHPQLRRVTVGAPTGPVALPAPPVRWASFTASLGDVPAIDSHGAAIRAAFA